MGEGLKHRFHGNPKSTSYDDEDSEELLDSESFSSDAEDDHSTEDANSLSATPLASDSCNGPLYELSSLMQELPMKRGLSKHYQGKSQSFTSLADVQSLEDLPKKETTYIRKMKPCMSYAGEIDATQNSGHAQGSRDKAKKTPRVSSCASFVSNSSGSKPPSLPAQKSYWPK